MEIRPGFIRRKTFSRALPCAECRIPEPLRQIRLYSCRQS